MTESDAAKTQAAFVEAALRLVDEHPGTTAGSVLRCYSRVVRQMRRAGAPMSQLPTRAEALTSQMLADRSRPGVQTWGTLRRDAAGTPELHAVSA